MQEERLIDIHSFSSRLKDAIFPEKLGAFADRAGISMGVLSKYLNPNENMSPSVEVLARICKATSTSFDWLLLGIGDAPAAADDDVILIPIYDVRFSGGTGLVTDQEFRSGFMPFDRKLLLSLGVTSTEGLGVVELRGNSMEPLIADRGRVLLSFLDTDLREDIFAFRLGDDLRIKMLRPIGLGGVEAISANPLYPAERLEGDIMSHFQIIGRALWVGTPL